MLDEKLWNSLAAVGWQHPAWVQGCTLEHGHDGDHRAPPYHAGDTLTGRSGTTARNRAWPPLSRHHRVATPAHLLNPAISGDRQLRRQPKTRLRLLNGRIPHGRKLMHCGPSLRPYSDWPT
jgi:hypothetical protein